MATSTDLRAAIEEVNRNRSTDGEVALSVRGPDWATRLEQRMGALPWWVISAVVHAALFLLITLLAVALPQPVQDEVIISTDVAQEKPPEYDEKKPRDIFKNPNEIQHETTVENPILIHEQVEVSDHFETDNDMDQQTSRGQEDAISDIPLGGTGISGSIGVGGGGMAGCFGYRNGGGRKNAVGRFGGSPATESAVEAALRWLARHQEADGHWDCRKYAGAGSKRPIGAEHDVGVTGLALLAFLGAGYTEKSGQFADNVKRAEDWLMQQQHKDPVKDKNVLGALYTTRSGPWQVIESAGYSHAIAGLALAEAFGMSGDPRLGEAAQLAVDYSVGLHQKPYSGWRYSPKERQSDVSVTGWYVMQLKSAKIAGLKVDGAAFQGAQAFIDEVTEKTGASQGMVRYIPSHDASTTMTAVGMVCRLFMGAPNTEPQLLKGAEWLARDLPDWNKAAGNERSGKNSFHDESFYYWYYGTLAMFQVGGDSWQKWNEALKPVLVNNQCKGGALDGSPNDTDGSWDPVAHNDRYGGRVYTTAIGALSLEVYYRYLPMYAK